MFLRQSAATVAVGSRPLRVGIVVGTRPEAIKMAPVVAACRAAPGIEPILVATGQHRDLVEPVLDFFGLSADVDLGCMGAGGVNGLLSRAVAALDGWIAEAAPDLLLVHGDTTSALAGALAAFHRRVPVAHVEAGLRTHDLSRPFPEEMNRQVIDRIAALHYAPTPGAAAALAAEGHGPEGVRTVGNTVIDALLMGLERLGPPPPPAEPGMRRVLVTLHRREGLEGGGLAAAARAVARIAARGDVLVTLPVHPNPAVGATIRRHLEGRSGVRLTAPLDYPSFLAEMRAAHVILTDSGGIQEEAPSLNVPVLVLRERTERPEAVEAGAARLVGLGEERIVAECARLLDDPSAHAAMAAAPSPFGDGTAAAQIVSHLLARAGAAA